VDARSGYSIDVLIKGVGGGGGKGLGVAVEVDVFVLDGFYGVVALVV
jgi:acetyl/propionyl-CoA carboxylase alpha subunit